MSTASYVPPTKGTSTKEVKDTISAASTGKILKDAFLRFRYADGFSFARAMAFQIVLTVIPGMIFVVALAVRLGEGSLQSLLRESVTTLAPGPASEIFLRALEQGSSAGRANLIAIVAGGLAALISGVAGMSQLQRGASRIYGVLGDRTTVRRYGLAAGLTLSAGVLLSGAFLLIVLGSNLVGALQGDVAEVWAWARWPIGVAALTLGLAGLFKLAPNRPQPAFSWLTLGSGVAVLGWLLVSLGLSIYLNASTTFGETYGPLAGFIGVMLWAQLSSIAIFYGLAVAAQVESERAGITSPTSETPEEASA